MKTKRVDIFSIVIIIFNILLAAIIYNHLPNKIPMHLNADFQVDRYGNRSEIFGAAFMPAIIYLLFYFLGFTEKKVQKNIGAYKVIARGVTIVMSLTYYWILANALGYKLKNGSIMLIIIGALFMVIGNFMPQLKPNYLAGIRLPWTLKDEDTWRVSHRIGGYCTIILGLLLILMSFIVPESYASSCMLIILLIWTLVLCIFSYVYYKRKHRSY